jgi:hypothetical protein
MFISKKTPSMTDEHFIYLHVFFLAREQHHQVFIETVENFKGKSRVG